MKLLLKGVVMTSPKYPTWQNIRHYIRCNRVTVNMVDKKSLHNTIPINKAQSISRYNFLFRTDSKSISTNSSNSPYLLTQRLLRLK